ncbi:MAG: hypothetical protein HS126_06195 [Anaerolineales bacterium]|nr:hypothetical protein [Anaerolineales bacterium]
MQINWTLITCVVIVFFAWSGYARGWWKEAITTAFLAVLILLLQQPAWAKSLIDGFNSLVSTIWGFIPSSIQTLINDILETFLGVSTGGGAIQANASDPGTWIIILILAVAVSTLLGRAAFANKPTPLGAIFGVLIGSTNGFLVLNLVREYLDGRALPGRAVASAEITQAGTSAFGPASPTISIQATNLPSFTILDSAVPYIFIGAGLVLAIAVINTRIALKTNKEGGRKIDTKVVPPFYKSGPPPKPTELNTLVKDIKKMFNES